MLLVSWKARESFGGKRGREEREWIEVRRRDSSIADDRGRRSGAESERKECRMMADVDAVAA